MKHRQDTPRARTAVAERSTGVLPYLLFGLFLALLSGQANAQGHGKGGEVRWERKRWNHDEIPATLPAPVRDAVADAVVVVAHHQHALRAAGLMQ